MHIDVVQLHIAIALGVVALAARVADRERRPRGSSLARFSPVRLLVRSRSGNEVQSTTPSRSISIIWLVALVVVSGIAVGCARSPGVPSGAAGADGTVRSQHLGEDFALEESVLDLYSAARNGYLQRRRAAIALAARERDQEWAWMEKSPAVEPQPQTASSGNRENHT